MFVEEMPQRDALIWEGRFERHCDDRERDNMKYPQMKIEVAARTLFL